MLALLPPFILKKTYPRHNLRFALISFNLYLKSKSQILVPYTNRELLITCTYNSLPSSLFFGSIRLLNALPWFLFKGENVNEAVIFRLYHTFKHLYFLHWYYILTLSYHRRSQLKYTPLGGPSWIPVEVGFLFSHFLSHLSVYFLYDALESEIISWTVFIYCFLPYRSPRALICHHQISGPNSEPGTG